ncbi:uncharacterized protein LACBIDRAFT_303434 [Laccaria bicolor S238N-H82]|uniref:Predicted protein n=1 Tax=Laccaria bicolor (strain S238N-H82 / ATCC MYA-4686) TaxID=486041 RepID=B0DJG1_LACBS|nr:uncharacterized protein LACBIDRAFT_303434 [Laccaria bicolor S238N-H82]EDR05112.1 predicted protein [Laccaria bicolor S238N-H82]|eukprot:XP_001884077.1 predicted protein [Laccaria bicolor S238N-H82]
MIAVNQISQRGTQLLRFNKNIVVARIGEWIMGWIKNSWKGKLRKTFSPVLPNVPSRVSPSNHLSSMGGHSIPHPARPSAGWSRPPRFPYMRPRHAPTNPHGKTSTGTLILGRKVTGRRR